MKTLVLIPLALTVGCSSAKPWAGGHLADVLTNTGACGDARFYAHDGGTTMVLLDMTGVIDGGPVQNYTLPDPAAPLVLQVGTNLDNQACTDVIENATNIQDSWAATSGQITITLAPTSADPPTPDATLQLIDVVFGDDDPERSLAYFEVFATLGNYPG